MAESGLVIFGGGDGGGPETDPAATAALGNHLADTTDAHDASAISVAAPLTEGNAQAEMERLSDAVETSSPVEDYTQGTDAGFGFGANWEAFDWDNPTQHPPTTYPPQTHFKYQGSKIWIRPRSTAPMANLSAVYNSPIYTISDEEAAEFAPYYGGQFYPNVLAYGRLFDVTYTYRNASAFVAVYFAAFGDGGNNGVWFGGLVGPFIDDSTFAPVATNADDKVMIGNSFMIDTAYPDAT